MLVNEVCYFGNKIGVVYKGNFSDILPMFVNPEGEGSPLCYRISPNDGFCLLPEFGLTRNVDFEGLEPSK